jgi:hypothetical protein
MTHRTPSIYDAAMTSEPDPPWLRDAARAVGHEVAGYFATALTIARAPSQFAANWGEGRVRALNPLAFMLNALAVLGPWRALWARLLDPNPPTTPLWFEMAKPVLPVVINVSVTALFHALVRAMGSSRPLRSSLALALYTTGGPLALVNFLAAPVMLAGYLHHTPLVFALWMVANLVALAVFFVYLVAMETALHRLGRWRVTLAALVSWTCWAVLSAWLNFHHPELIRSLLGG